MENITPPMPAKRALAVLDQPAPADVGRRSGYRKRSALQSTPWCPVSARRWSMRPQRSGSPAKACPGALSTPHVAEHFRQKVIYAVGSDQSAAD
jgi:hypothetical protein